MSGDALAAIEAQNLGVRLGDHPALTGLNFRLPEGAFLAIIGPNGGGKSTLLKILLGLIEPTSGKVSVLGRAPREIPAGQVGYVPQFKTLDRRFPALALELVATGLRPRWPWRLGSDDRGAALGALARVGAERLASKRIKHLSGGELQRVYLARAMVRRPKLILLDEPSAGMDAAGEIDLRRVLEDCRSEFGASIAMVTHDWGDAYHHASHVLALDRRVVGFGPARETLTEKCLRETFGHVGHAHAMTFSAPGSGERRREEKNNADV